MTLKKTELKNALEELQLKINKLEADNLRLKESNNAISGLQPIQDRLLSEMDKLGRKSVVSSGTRMAVIDDHKNIKLYHTNGYHIGKFVGPLHPSNAELEMRRFSRRGIMLSIDQPTPDQIAAYKETEEYKRLAKAFDSGRSKKIKTRRSGEMERLAQAIEKMSGVKVVNQIEKA